MTNSECARAEILGGAIALNEASDAERDAYRRHLASCERCLATLGGERSIERTMSVVARARDQERWEPSGRDALGSKAAPRHAWRYGVAIGLGAIVASGAIHALVAAGIPRNTVTSSAPVVIGYQGEHIDLEHRAAAVPRPIFHPTVHQLIVVHNVVTLPRPAASLPHPAALRPAARPTLDPAIAAAAHPSERDERSIAVLDTTATALPEHRAESLALLPPAATVVRGVSPIGGEDAIVPHPSQIAYDEGAQGTTAIEVSVDQHGTPVKCTITKSAGYLVLDDAVCRAAMQARYSPQTINGRPVSSTYRDAFTFRSTDEQ